MTIASCPSEEELSRALDSGDDPRITFHVAGCARCRETQASFRDVIEHSKKLPVTLPDPSRREQVRAALLARGAMEPTGRPGRTRWVFAFAAVAAVVLVMSIARVRPEAPAFLRSHVVIRAGVGARYELSAPPWETVRLWDGKIDLDVEPLGPGERVRVEVADGEVEVRGTRFQVTAHEDHLVSVEVTHGRVEVRPLGAPMTVLGAGQSWTVPAVVAVGEPPPTLGRAREESAPRVPRPRAHARVVGVRSEAAIEHALRPTRQEQLYDDAWDALRARRFEAAARGFERVLSESPNGSLADEAAFWRATSLARGGQSDQAIGAFTDFGRKYRSSPRRLEAATILGWLLVDAHRPDEAAPLFRDAVNAPDANVRKSARDGLEATTRR
jgi:hypothetical protein